jgi:hypothetical protein
VAIGARAQEAGVVGGVLLAGLTEIVDDLALGELARNIEIAREAVLGRNHSEQLVDGGSANGGQHLLAFGGRFG